MLLLPLLMPLMHTVHVAVAEPAALHRHPSLWIPVRITGPKTPAKLHTVQGQVLPI